MPIDYDRASQNYDATRTFDPSVVDALNSRTGLAKGSKVLDFGCGTGNYLGELHRRFCCECYGVEPSRGMRDVATAKHPKLVVRDGDHRRIPFDDATFDLIYMTDVIHHVPDMSSLFQETHRCLSKGGLLAIVTESHAQITARFYNTYFPSLSASELRRYPSVVTIIDLAAQSALAHLGTDSMPVAGERTINQELIATVSAKNFSMFHSLSKEEFEAGLAALIADEGRAFPPGDSGKTLLWFRR